MGRKTKPLLCASGPVISSWIEFRYCWCSRCKFGRRPSQRSFGITRDHQQIFANNSRLKRTRDMGKVSLCLSCHEASTDTQHDLRVLTYVTSQPLSCGQILTLLLNITRCSFEAPLTREMRWCPNYDASFLSPKVSCAKNVFAKNRNFDVFWPLVPKSLMLAQNWWYVGERKVEEQSNSFFCGP